MATHEEKMKQSSDTGFDQFMNSLFANMTTKEIPKELIQLTNLQSTILCNDQVKKIPEELRYVVIPIV